MDKNRLKYIGTNFYSLRYSFILYVFASLFLGVYGKISGSASTSRLGLYLFLSGLGAELLRGVFFYHVVYLYEDIVFIRYRLGFSKKQYDYSDIDRISYNNSGSKVIKCEIVIKTRDGKEYSLQIGNKESYKEILSYLQSKDLNVDFLCENKA